MEQLSGIDSAFLALESENTPMHVCGLLIYQGVGGQTGDELLASVRSRFEKILDQFPIFRQRLSEKPRLVDDHLYWIDDETFDLDQHVHLRTLPAPGGWSQLSKLAADIHAVPVHLKFPLWDAFVIDGFSATNGFEEGSFAILIKVHHAAVDGASMSEILTELHSNVSNIEGAEPWVPQRKPGTMEVVWKAYSHQISRRMMFWKTVAKLVPLRAQVGEEEPDSRRQLTQKFSTRFNERIGVDRVFGSIELRLDEIIQCKAKVQGATVNDVVVSIVGGGLRKFLSEVGELTYQTLVTGAPINVRAEGSKFSSANQISMMRIPLCTHIEDPIERLAAVTSGSAKSKASARSLGLKTLSEVAQSLDPSFLALGIRAATSNIVGDIINTPVHTMVSNVPGPRQPMYLGNAQLTRVMGLGPLVDKVGLFNTVSSVENSVSVSFVSTADMLPEPELYASCLREAYNELCNA